MNILKISFQNMAKKYLLYLTLIIFPLIGAQCIQIKKGPTGLDGGVFRSVNSGQEWQQKVVIPTAAGLRNFASANVIFLTQDPSDRFAIYAGTAESGMLYTYDGGESWRQPKEIASGKVNAVVVDPKNKCNIYAAAQNRVLKSSDCNRTFVEIYRSTAEITTIAVDHYNSSILYIGTSDGIILKSLDTGASWSALRNFGGRIIDIVVNPKDSRMLYAAVFRKGVWKTIDGGGSWNDVSESIKKIRSGTEIKRLVISNSDPNILILASKYNLLRSKDGGANWEELTLPDKPGTIEVYALAIDSKDANNLYYSSAKSFYRSRNAGASWSTSKLPTARAASFLLIDALEPSVIYMGAMKLEK